MTALFHATIRYHALSDCWTVDYQKSPKIIGEFALTWGFLLVGPTGLEPVASCVSSKRSTGLS